MEFTFSLGPPSCSIQYFLAHFREVYMAKLNPWAVLNNWMNKHHGDTNLSAKKDGELIEMSNVNSNMRVNRIT